jgi:hypothetical protein
VALARLLATTFMSLLHGGGREFKLLDRPHVFGPPQFNEHNGFAHFPGLHFHVHCGLLHLLSHCSEHFVVHLGGAQSALQPGHSPW